MAYTFVLPDNTLVQRDDGALIPWGANRPADTAGVIYQKWVADGSPVPSAYVAPALTADQSRNAALDADTDRQNILQAIKGASPAQIKNYINNNVTDLASARTMLIRLALLVAKAIQD